MKTLSDTIVAPITPPGRGAVALVRLSGPEAWVIAGRLFSRLPSEPEPRRAYYGRFVHGDDGYLILFAAEASYTGEPSAECSIHGSPASVEALLDAAIREGARAAGPGEFTQRAFLNGRIDLSQAEAVRETIEAQTERQLRHANRLREGALATEVGGIRDAVIGVLAAIEASVDFSEEIGEIDRTALRDRTLGVRQAVVRLHETQGRGEILRHGVRVAILGRPNAGKSSLLNALLGRARAIVTPIPGTTRDYLEETMEVGGVPLTFVDTAGLRTTDDQIEAEGIERSRSISRGADFVLYLYDAAVGWTSEDDAEVQSLDRTHHVYATKSDLIPHHAPAVGDVLSVVTGQGLSGLLDRLKAFVGEIPEVTVSARHAESLSACGSLLEEAAATIGSSRPLDLAVPVLQGAIASLGEITGETASPDIIDRIFRDFCIGK